MIQGINWLFQIYFYMIFAYVLMSWLPQVRESKIGEILGRFVEPYLAIFRRFIPPIGILDLSAMVGLFALFFIQRGLITVITLLFSALR
ncbi:MAG: YggT family protein [Bacilli bacterium]